MLQSSLDYFQIKSNSGKIADMDDSILEKINKASLKFLTPLDLDEIYATVVKEAVSLVNGSTGSLLLERDGDLYRVYSLTADMSLVKTRRSGYTHTCFTKKAALVVHKKDLIKAHPEVKYPGMRSMIFIPLSYKNKPTGVLQVRSSMRESFTKRELNILKLYGSLASLAIRKGQLYDETKQALETRDLFISMAAHELRTPLTSVNGYIQLLNSKFTSSGTIEPRWIEQLSYESLRLTYLINELLEVNRVKTGRLQFEFKECSLREVIYRAMNNFEFNFPERKITFEDNLKETDKVAGDFDKLLQSLNNLLDNAAKFSSATSEVKLSLSNKYSYLVIKIIDKGKGIAKKDFPKIMEGFYKTDEFKQGMGIGLFLAKYIINRHQGLLEIHSKENKGTTVTIKLPKLKI